MKSHEQQLAEEKRFASQEFGIPEEDVLWYNSGSCYDRVKVKTQESADKVSAKVKGQTANGGMLHGMPLGGQSKDENGIEIYC